VLSLSDTAVTQVSEAIAQREGESSTCQESVSSTYRRRGSAWEPRAPSTGCAVVTTLDYQLLADGVLSLHVALVAFVIGGLLVVIGGNLRDWRWVNAFWFRLVHLAAIGVVATEAWLGDACPLTSVELWLRGKAGAAPYAGSFIQYWLQRLLYYDAPAWVFTVSYSVFALAVAATWWVFPPGIRRASDTRAKGISRQV
jgi:hypothetical protein